MGNTIKEIDIEKLKILSERGNSKTYIHIEKLSKYSVDIDDKMWRYFIKYYKVFYTDKEIDDFNEYIIPYSIISAIGMFSMINKDGPKQF